jgi:hypothetical protein
MFMDYDHFPSHNPWHQNRCDQRDWETKFLSFALFDVVIGHFPMARYASDAYDHVTVIRHPLERAISEFFYLKHIMPETQARAIAILPEILQIKRGELSFTEYLHRTGADEFYLRYVGRSYLNECVLLGFHDSMDAFCRLFTNRTGIPLSAEVRERKNDSLKTLPQSELNAAHDFLRDEIAWYDEIIGMRRGAGRGSI